MHTEYTVIHSSKIALLFMFYTIVDRCTFVKSTHGGVVLPVCNYNKVYSIQIDE